MTRPGTFQKGNKAGAGVDKSRPDFLSQVLISQLNEVDAKTGQEKKHLLVERMLQLALGKVKVVNGEEVFERLPCATMIKEVWDRTQGKAPLQVNLGGDGILQLSVIEHQIVDPEPSK